MAKCLFESSVYLKPVRSVLPITAVHTVKVYHCHMT